MCPILNLEDKIDTFSPAPHAEYFCLDSAPEMTAVLLFDIKPLMHSIEGLFCNGDSMHHLADSRGAVWHRVGIPTLVQLLKMHTYWHLQQMIQGQDVHPMPNSATRKFVRCCVLFPLQSNPSLM